MAIVACDEPTPQEPPPPPEPPGLEIPGLNPAPLEDACDPPPPTTPGQGEAVWGMPERVEIPSGDDGLEPQIAVGGGRVYLAFRVGRIPPENPAPSELSDIYITRRERGSWSEPVNLSNSPTASTNVGLTVDDAGVAHVLWGEWIDDGTGQQQLLGPTSILFASNVGGEWSEPDTAWYATDKGLGFPWRPVLDAGGGVHMIVTPAVGADDTLSSQSRFFHRVRRGGAWSPTHPIYIGGASDLAIDSLGDLLVAYVVGDPRGSETNRDVNSVFFTRSEDGGVTWSRPQRIERGGREAAYYAHIAIGGDGRIHVIWARDTADPGTWPPDIVEHSYSTDGVCWSEPARVSGSLTGMAGPPVVLADDAGGLHVVYHRQAGGLGARPFQAIYAYWDGTSWREPVPLFGLDEVGLTVGLARDASGTLHLALRTMIDDTIGIYYATGQPAGGP